MPIAGKVHLRFAADHGRVPLERAQILVKHQDHVLSQPPAMVAAQSARRDIDPTVHAATDVATGAVGQKAIIEQVCDLDHQRTWVIR